MKKLELSRENDQIFIRRRADVDADGHRSLLCQSKDEEPNVNVALFYFGHGIKMYRERGSDGLKEKKNDRRDAEGFNRSIEFI